MVNSQADDNSYSKNYMHGWTLQIGALAARFSVIEASATAFVYVTVAFKQIKNVHKFKNSIQFNKQK